MARNKVFKRDDKHFETKLHAVRELEYKTGAKYLVTPYVRTWCNNLYELSDKDTYVPFVKEEHKEELCLKCKQTISVHYRRKERAKYSA